MNENERQAMLDEMINLMPRATKEKVAYINGLLANGTIRTPREFLRFFGGNESEAKNAYTAFLNGHGGSGRVRNILDTLKQNTEEREAEQQKALDELDALQNLRTATYNRLTDLGEQQGKAPTEDFNNIKTEIDKIDEKIAEVGQKIADTAPIIYKEQTRTEETENTTSKTMTTGSPTGTTDSALATATDAEFEDYQRRNSALATATDAEFEDYQRRNSALATATDAEFEDYQRRNGLFEQSITENIPQRADVSVNQTDANTEQKGMHNQNGDINITNIENVTTSHDTNNEITTPQMEAQDPRNIEYQKIYNDANNEYEAAQERIRISIMEMQRIFEEERRIRTEEGPFRTVQELDDFTAEYMRKKIEEDERLTNARTAAKIAENKMRAAEKRIHDYAIAKEEAAKLGIPVEEYERIRKSTAKKEVLQEVYDSQGLGEVTRRTREGKEQATLTTEEIINMVVNRINNSDVVDVNQEGATIYQNGIINQNGGLNIVIIDSLNFVNGMETPVSVEGARTTKIASNARDNVKEKTLTSPRMIPRTGDEPEIINPGPAPSDMTDTSNISVNQPEADINQTGALNQNGGINIANIGNITISEDANLSQQRQDTNDNNNSNSDSKHDTQTDDTADPDNNINDDTQQKLGFNEDGTYRLKKDQIIQDGVEVQKNNSFGKKGTASKKVENNIFDDQKNNANNSNKHSTTNFEKDVLAKEENDQRKIKDDKSINHIFDEKPEADQKQALNKSKEQDSTEQSQEGTSQQQSREPSSDEENSHTQQAQTENSSPFRIGGTTNEKTPTKDPLETNLGGEMKEPSKSRRGLLTIMDEVTQGLDLRKKDGKRYKASNIKVARNFIDELHSGNYLYNIVHLVPAIVKLPINLLRKISGKVMLSADSKRNISQLQERVNNLSEDDLMTIYEEYRGNRVIQERFPTILNTLLEERIQKFAIENVTNINTELELRYQCAFNAISRIEAIDAHLASQGVDETTRSALIAQRVALFEGQAENIAEIRKGYIEANGWLSGGSHGFSEDMKAATTKLSCVGKRFAKDHNLDGELLHRQAQLEQLEMNALASKDNEMALRAFIESERLLSDNTAIDGSIFGNRSTGKKYYSPLVEQLDYRDDPFLKDLFTTVALTSAAVSATKALHETQTGDLTPEQIAAIQRNEAMMKQVNEYGKQIADSRGVMMEGMKSQNIQGTLTASNEIERATLDSTDWGLGTTAYRAADNAGHEFYNSLYKSTEGAIETIASKYAQGAITQAEAMDMMAELSANSQATLQNVTQECMNILQPYAASHPQFDLSGVDAAMQYMVQHPTAIAEMNQAMVNATAIGDTLSKLQLEHVAALQSMPSDVQSYFLTCASSAALAANVVNSAQAARKHNYGNNVTDMVNEYAAGVASHMPTYGREK